MSEHKRPARMAHGPGGPGGMAPGEKAKNFRGTVKKLLQYMGRYKIGVLVVLIFAVASTVFGIAGPKILGNATTELFNGLVAQAAEQLILVKLERFCYSCWQSIYLVPCVRLCKVLL